MEAVSPSPSSPPPPPEEAAMPVATALSGPPPKTSNGPPTGDAVASFPLSVQRLSRPWSRDASGRREDLPPLPQSRGCGFPTSVTTAAVPASSMPTFLAAPQTSPPPAPPLRPRSRSALPSPTVPRSVFATSGGVDAAAAAASWGLTGGFGWTRADSDAAAAALHDLNFALDLALGFDTGSLGRRQPSPPTMAAARAAAPQGSSGDRGGRAADDLATVSSEFQQVAFFDARAGQALGGDASASVATDTGLAATEPFLQDWRSVQTPSEAGNTSTDGSSESNYGAHADYTGWPESGERSHVVASIASTSSLMAGLGVSVNPHAGLPFAPSLLDLLNFHLPSGRPRRPSFAGMLSLSGMDIITSDSQNHHLAPDDMLTSLGLDAWDGNFDRGLHELGFPASNNESRSELECCGVAFTSLYELLDHYESIHVTIRPALRSEGSVADTGLLTSNQSECLTTPSTILASFDADDLANLHRSLPATPTIAAGTFFPTYKGQFLKSHSNPSSPQLSPLCVEPAAVFARPGALGQIQRRLSELSIQRGSAVASRDQLQSEISQLTLPVEPIDPDVLAILMHDATTQLPPPALPQQQQVQSLSLSAAPGASASTPRRRNLSMDWPAPIRQFAHVDSRTSSTATTTATAAFFSSTAGSGSEPSSASSSKPPPRHGKRTRVPSLSTVLPAATKMFRSSSESAALAPAAGTAGAGAADFSSAVGELTAIARGGALGLGGLVTPNSAAADGASRMATWPTAGSENGFHQFDALASAEGPESLFRPATVTAAATTGERRARREDDAGTLARDWLAMSSSPEPRGFSAAAPPPPLAQSAYMVVSPPPTFKRARDAARHRSFPLPAFPSASFSATADAPAAPVSSSSSSSLPPAHSLGATGPLSATRALGRAATPPPLRLHHPSPVRLAAGARGLSLHHAATAAAGVALPVRPSSTPPATLGTGSPAFTITFTAATTTAPAVAAVPATSLTTTTPNTAATAVTTAKFTASVASA
ncbi:hypothetical protein HK405_005498, partial [Cladochytrium tenue]